MDAGVNYDSVQIRKGELRHSAVSRMRMEAELSCFEAATRPDVTGTCWYCRT